MQHTYKLSVTIVVLGFLTLSLFSCNNKETTTITPSDNLDILGIIEKYYKVSNVKSDGTFMFELNLANNDPSIINTVLMGGLFYDKNGNIEKGGGEVMIGDNKLVPNNQGSYGFDTTISQKGLYGTTVSFTLNTPLSHGSKQGASPSAKQNTPSDMKMAPVTPPDGGGGGPVITTPPIYSPLAIYITNVPPRTPLILTYNTSTTLTWNVDLNNPNGVVIIAEYFPTRYINKDALQAGYAAPSEMSMLVSDNGSTTIPWSFFSNFPPNGHIILWIARGNYTIASNGTYNYKVGGYSAAAVWDVLIPSSTSTAPPVSNPPVNPPKNGKVSVD